MEEREEEEKEAEEWEGKKRVKFSQEGHDSEEESVG